jgi:copper oxidase (laccase) domain-containing protein
LLREKMSKTKKGAKGPGYEYWSKRPCAGDSPGRKTKKITHKKERLANKLTQDQVLDGKEQRHEDEVRDFDKYDDEST